jgi:hypothetical protein
MSHALAIMERNLTGILSQENLKRTRGYENDEAIFFELLKANPTTI